MEGEQTGAEDGKFPCGSARSRNAALFLDSCYNIVGGGAEEQKGLQHGGSECPSRLPLRVSQEPSLLNNKNLLIFTSPECCEA